MNVRWSKVTTGGRFARCANIRSFREVGKNADSVVVMFMLVTSR